jgi:hypothetical protein
VSGWIITQEHELKPLLYFSPPASKDPLRTCSGAAITDTDQLSLLTKVEHDEEPGRKSSAFKSVTFASWMAAAETAVRDSRPLARSRGNVSVHRTGLEKARRAPPQSKRWVKAADA